MLVTKTKTSRQKRKGYRWEHEESNEDEPSPKRAINQVLTEVVQLRKEINGVMDLSKTSKLPPGLKVMLLNTFKCSICHSSINPPVAYARCCQSIVGCEHCVDRWYSGDEGRMKNCPLCRRERASSEMSRLNGLNDFLDGIKVFFDDENDYHSGADFSQDDDPDNFRE